jgi:hypothetical protein
MFDTEARAVGWIQIEEVDPEGDGSGEDVFDIDPAVMRFDVLHGDKQVTYDDLEDLYHTSAEVRVSPEFMRGVVTDRHGRCKVFWSNRYKCIGIKDWKTGGRHFPKDIGPPDMAKCGNFLKQLADGLGISIPDRMEWHDEVTATDSTPPAEAADAWDPWRQTPVPKLDHALLPDAVRNAAAASAEVSGADLDAFAIGYLVGLAACCDTRLRITPKQHARDWAVPLVLWSMLVAPPSSMKTAVFKAARDMAASLDMADRDQHRRDVEAAKLGTTLDAAKRKLKSAEAKRVQTGALQKVAPPRQRVCGDITIEKLAEILNANPGGCAIFRDEMSGWLASLGRYTPNGGDGQDRAFYCAMRDGTAHHRQRKSSPHVHIEYCAGSFFTAIQLNRLTEFKLPTSDGLLATVSASYACRCGPSPATPAPRSGWDIAARARRSGTPAH